MNPRQDSLRTIGEYLRATRQEQELDLYDLSERLRIRPAYLFALEEGDFDALPARAYAFGFLRSYAEALGFDGDEVVAEVKHRLSEVAEPDPIPQARQPIADRRWPSVFAMAASIALALVVYGVWQFGPSLDRQQLADVGSWPGEIGARLSQLVESTRAQVDGSEPASDNGPSLAGNTGNSAEPIGSAPAETPGTGEIGSAVAGGNGAVGTQVQQDRAANGGAGSIDGQSGDALAQAPLFAPESTASSAGTLSETGDAFATGTPVLARLTAREPDSSIRQVALLRGTPSPASTGESDAPAPERLVASESFGDADGPGRVVLVAHEPSWIRVQSGDGSYSWTRILEAGERYFMPQRRDLALWTGNAGGFDVVIDGRNLGTLGPRGTVMRDVILAPDELQASLR